MLGDLIYEYVMFFVSSVSTTEQERLTPKITGMLLDLEEADFSMTMKSYEIFKTKVLEAYQIILQQAPNESSSNDSSLGNRRDQSNNTV